MGLVVSCLALPCLALPCRALPYLALARTTTFNSPPLTSPSSLSRYRGWTTLLQLARASPWLPCPLTIRDRPAFRERGLMLDVSRDRVPTMDDLFLLVRKMARLKLNHLQLYIEHTFEYRDHGGVHRESSPLTRDEIRTLRKFCDARFVVLVPNQNVSSGRGGILVLSRIKSSLRSLQTLGHMHRWLKHERYRALSECPAGVPHFFSGGEGMAGAEPFSLCAVDPDAFALVSELVGEMGDAFWGDGGGSGSAGGGGGAATAAATTTATAVTTTAQSQRPLYFHVGLDEAFDLCRERGKGTSKVAAWTSWLTRLRTRLREVREGRGKDATLLIWGDFLKSNAEAIAKLPTDGSVVVCEWGYEASDDFAPALSKLRAAGVPAFVCPGTSGWNSIAGRWTNAEANLRRAAVQGVEHGAIGYLITDWGGETGIYAPRLSISISISLSISISISISLSLSLPPSRSRSPPLVSSHKDCAKGN